MLDDSLSAGNLEQATSPESPSVTVSDTHDVGLTRASDLDEPRQLSVGDRFAGFQIRGILGRGAMGVVYEAWDPTLERRVALKLLRSPTKRAAERLLREARALARLDHPGVVRIWAADVHRGAVYIAMELIEGQSLREWMKTPRSWGEVLPVLIGAGRGLAAAHAAGVIHRDFKPENVLVGWDGQARVLDFGIARISLSHPDHLTHSLDGSSAGDGDGQGGGAPLSGSFAGTPLETDEQLTEAGTLIGTLLYMSPEQHGREPADERSDQFSFCMTLFEAIYDRRPFPAQTREQLALKVLEGQIEFPAEGRTKVPRWLEKVIVKGLSTKPEERYPDMDALIDALERHPARRRLRNRVITIAAVVVGAVSLGLMVPRAEPVDPCLDVGAELEPVLGEQARKDITAHFASIDAPWAVGMGQRVDAALVGWTGRWLEARTQVCRARHEHREVSALDERREACLDAQLARVGALGTVPTQARPRTLTNADQALAALPEPEVCVGDDPPEDPTRVDGQEALAGELAELLWLSLTSGGDEQTRKRAKGLVEQIRALTPSPATKALLADALVSLAYTELLDGDRIEAEANFREARRTAERIEADGIRARATVLLGWTLATSPGRATEAIEVLDDADALLERTGNPRFEQIRRRQGLAEALLAVGQLDRAEQILDGLLDEQDGSTTTLVGASRVAAAKGEHAKALELAERALELAQAQFGDDHPLLAAPLTNIGHAHTDLGDYEPAKAALTRAIDLRRRQLDSEPTPGNRALLGQVLISLANLESMHGHGDIAADVYREALEQVPEDDLANRALVLFNLGVDHQLANRNLQALANYQEALRLAERIHPMDHDQVVGARLGVGSVLVSLDRPAEARAYLERCLADWPASMRGRPDEAELRFGLARTLVALDGWSEQAELFAIEAEAIYRRKGLIPAADEVAEWIVAQRPA